MPGTDLVIPTNLRDRVLLPGDADYEIARRLDNAAIDRHPAAIVRVRDVDDVVAALAWARSTVTALAVRGGGHSTPGYGVADDAIVLDMADMDGLEMDLATGTAWIEAGATAGAVTSKLHPAGFVIPFGDTGSVGIGGLTLGGGIGWLARRDGLTIDSLLAAELVTDTGDRLTTSATEHPDLFWALRGGGGNFGVVTRFRFRLTRLDTVLAGRVTVEATPAALARLVDVQFGAPDGLTVITTLLHLPRAPEVLDGWQGRLPDAWRGRLVASMRVAHSGPTEDDERVLDLLRSIAPAVEDSVERKPYPALFPPAGGGPRMGFAVRSMFLDGFQASAVEAIARRLADPAMSDAWIQLRVLGGAASRVADDATAFGHRARRAAAVIIAAFEDLATAARHEDWVAGFEAELLAAGCGPGAFVSFLGTSDDAALHAAYPPTTLARLRDVKRRHDPDNVFRSNLNIPPAAEAPKSA